MSGAAPHHSCGRSSPQWGIFEVSECMACAVLLARSGARGGWTVTMLSRAMAELRLHDKFTDGVEPDQQDIDRAELAFDLARGRV